MKLSLNREQEEFVAAFAVVVMCQDWKKCSRAPGSNRKAEKRLPENQKFPLCSAGSRFSFDHCGKGKTRSWPSSKLGLGLISSPLH